AGLSDVTRRFDITWFLGAIHKYRHLLSEVLLASFFLQLFALVSPLFFQVVIDKVLVHRALSTLDVLVIGLLAISAFETILGILPTYLFAHTPNRIDVELGARLFHHLLALPMAYFQARRVGDSVARVRELENIRNFLTSSALTLVIDLFFTFVFLAVMFFYSAADCDRIRLIPVLHRNLGRGDAAVPAAAGRKIPARRGDPSFFDRERDRHRDAQGYGGRAADAAPLGRTARRLCDGEFPGPESRQQCEPGGAARQQGRHRRPPLFRRQASHRWQLVGRRARGLQHPPGRARLPAIRGNIKFDHVTFRYRIDGPEVLHDVSFDVPAGQMVGIVGPSGSGKSTFAKLVQRLYVPESGRVLVDGMDLAMADPAWLRRQIGVVLQENVLFNRSVRDNIALADPAMPMERVIAAARPAGAHEFILELSEGYDTIVGERGSTLSGGQRQRIAIARALITDPRILIFDEATSALDYESERIIQQNMKEIAKGRTVLVIA